MNRMKELLQQLQSVFVVLMVVLIVIMYALPADAAATGSQEDTGNRDLSGKLKTVKIVSDRERFESGETVTFTIDYALCEDAEAQAGDILDLHVSGAAEEIETEDKDNIFSGINEAGCGEFKLVLSKRGAENASGDFKVSFKINNKTQDAVIAAISFGKKVKEVSYAPEKTTEQASDKKSGRKALTDTDTSKAADDDYGNSDKDADEELENDQQGKAKEQINSSGQAPVTSAENENSTVKAGAISDNISRESSTAIESKKENTKAAVKKKETTRSASLKAAPQEAASGFNATISSVKTEYGAGVMAIYTVDYTVTPGALNPGDYIIVTAPSDVVSDVDFLTASNHFSGIENLGNGQYKLTFADDITTAISGSFTMFITTADVEETTTEPITVGNDSASITVNPKGPAGTGVYTDTIMKDAADQSGTGSTVEYGDYDYSEGYGDNAAQIGILSRYGDCLKYRIYVNDKKGTLTNITVTDTLPDGMTFTTDAIEVTDRDTGNPVDENLYTVTKSGNTLVFNYPGQLSGQTLQINYWVKINPDDALESKYTNRADISYTENGNQYNDHRNYVLQGSNFNASNGEKSVNKTEISSDGSQYVTYTFKFWNQQGFAAGAIKLTDVLDEHVKFVDASNNEYFTVTNDGQNVHIENTKPIPGSSTQYVRFIVDMSDVPEGYTVKNSVGGNTVTTTKKAKISLKAVKTVNNEEPGSNNIFRFQLLDKDGNPLQTKENSADGSISFDSIEYSMDDVGKTFTYTVREIAGSDATVTYDDTEYTVKVIVSKDDGGHLSVSKTIIKNSTEVDGITFNNIKQSSEVTAALSVTKALDGRNWRSGDFFMFKLAAVTADAPLPEETTVTATSDNRSPSFGDVTYSEEGTYEYKITEIEGSIAGITYDLSDHTAVVKVERGNDGKLHVTATYDGDDSLTVKNSYRAASTDIAFSGTKTLIGRTLEDKQFTFAVYDENENEVAVGMNDASGKITFGSIKYTETGTYNYTIKELGEDGNGITTDKNVRKVTVIVSDNGNGKLDAVLADDSDSITFNNIYQAEDTHVQFRGIKTLEGKKLKDGEFCFILKDKDTGRTLQTVRNDAEGNIIFKEITYSRAGKYTYTISESADEENGVIFDSTVYEVTVTVTDDGNGQLTAEVSGAAADGSGLDFTNKYETVSIKAEKIWNDGNNRDGLRKDVKLYLNKTVNGKTEQIAGQEKVISKDASGDELKVSWNHLPKYENDEEISYTVTEEAVDGYKTVVTGCAETGFVVTNTHTPEKINVAVVKKWADKSDQDGIRPDSIQIQLLADGEACGSPVRLSKSNNWSCEWTDLDKNKDGTAINYMVKEAEVSGYKTTIAGSANESFIITNVHKISKINIKGQKKWIDNDDKEGKRPSSITVHLYADGKQVASKKVTAKDDWKYSFPQLDEYKNGRRIKYTVTEDAVEYYQTKITGYDITNIYQTSQANKKNDSTKNIITKKITPVTKASDYPDAGKHVKTSSARGDASTLGLVSHSSDTGGGREIKRTSASASSPKTDDKTNLIPFSIACVLAGIMTGIFVRRKRQENPSKWGKKDSATKCRE